GAISVGSDGDNDVILFADRLEPRHLRIDGAANMLSTPRIHALEGRIEVDGVALFPGDSVELMEGTVVSADETVMRIGRVGYPQDLRQLALRIALAAVAIAAVAVGLTLARNLAVAAASLGAGRVATVESAAPGAPALGRPARPPVATAEPAALERQVAET